jgi:diguanylate cyclase (GGDEF)-like protein/PAS domain S-box-containing protein
VKRRIRILHVEDNEADAQLMARALRSLEYDAAWTRVETEEAFLRALEPLPDVVIADYHLPRFSGLRALELLKARQPDVPLIVVSGAIGEERAVEMIRLGAADYLLKDRLARLPSAVQNAVRAAQDISTRKHHEEELERFRLALDNSADIVLITDIAAMRHVDANDAACRLLGYSREQLLRMGPQDILPLSREALAKTYADLIADPSQPSGMMSYYLCKDGSRLPFESTRRVLRSGGSWLLVAVSRDIRERIDAERALRESEAGLRRAQAMARLAHVITGPGGEFEKWSATLPELVGLAPEHMPRSTRAWLDLLHPQDRDRFRRTAIAAGKSRTRTKIAYRLRVGDGRWIHVRQTMDPRAAEEANPRWFNTIQDVTEQKEAEERIARLNRVYAVLSGINTLIVRTRERQELFAEACRIAVEAGRFRMAWLGIVEHEAMRVRPLAWYGTDADYIRRIPAGMTDIGPQGTGLAGRAAEEKTAVVVQDMADDPRVMLRNEAAERGYRSLAMLPLVVDGKSAGVLALYAGEAGFFDQEEMKLLHELAGDIAFALQHIERTEKLDYLAYYDPLTGLANRTLFHERLTQQLGAARREGRRAAFVMVDIERFKTINDSVGRHAGDALLREFGQRLRQVARDESWVARIGADQFAIAVPDVSTLEELGRRNDERLAALLAEPFRAGEAELRLSARTGIAVFPDDAADADGLFRNAEAALKRARATGQRSLFYKEEMTARVAEKLALENQLRRALEREEFVLHYQPKFDTRTREIVGLEALIRWQSPQRGLVPPMQFIPLLEETGLILPVGAWALRRAAADHRAWIESGLAAPRVAVNVSAIQLQQGDFVTAVEHAIMEGLAPVAIDLEITESLVMQDVEANVRKLNEVRGLGVRIAIDDFGTGYSSLAYLARLPVQALKIDRAFIITMLKDPAAMTLVQTIVSLAHALGLTVIAEGVDDEAQAKQLLQIGCDQMQGYLFARPLPKDDIGVRLKAGNAPW